MTADRRTLFEDHADRVATEEAETGLGVWIMRADELNGKPSAAFVRWEAVPALIDDLTQRMADRL